MRALLRVREPRAQRERVAVERLALRADDARARLRELRLAARETQHEVGQLVCALYDAHQCAMNEDSTFVAGGAGLVGRAGALLLTEHLDARAAVRAAQIALVRRLAVGTCSSCCYR